MRRNSSGEPEEEAKAAEEEPETEEEPSISEQMTKARQERETTAWAESEEPEAPSKKVGKWDRAAMQTWLKGPGYDVLGITSAEFGHLAESPLAPSEAESLYEIIRELNIRHPFDFERLIREADALINAEPIEGKKRQAAGLSDVLKIRRKGAMLTGRDVSALYGMDKIANRIEERLFNSPTTRRELSKYPPIPKDTAYADMTPDEKAHYVEIKALEYRALLRTFHEVYELANEAKQSVAGGKEAAAGKLAVPPDVEAFRTGALDRYGDKSRSALEQAAVQAQRAARERSISGQRSVLLAPETRQPVKPPGRASMASRYPQTLPRPGGSQEMLPPGTLARPFGEPTKGAFPPPPFLAPGQVGGPEAHVEGMPTHPTTVPPEFPFEKGAPRLAPENIRTPRSGPRSKDIHPKPESHLGCGAAPALPEDGG